MARIPSPHRPRHLARQRAVQALYQLQINPDSARVVVEQFLLTQDFSQVDAEYFRELVIRAGNQQEQIAVQYGPFLNIAWQQLDTMERAILSLAWVELCEQPQVPVKVVINEAVELTKRFGAEQSHTFINGVLDGLARTVRTLEAAEFN
ncbi:MAG: transcription antitermination factor NusB [Gammaproteobacteria bacterium]|jgi:N utilization substance protein B|nr:transcription antitermination factor NusB [Gammaproteobacteria bacterium]